MWLLVMSPMLLCIHNNSKYAGFLQYCSFDLIARCSWLASYCQIFRSLSQYIILLYYLIINRLLATPQLHGQLRTYMFIQVGNKQMVASYYTAALKQFLTIIISLNYFFLSLVASLTSKPLVIHHGDDTPTQYTSHVATQH